MRKFKVYSGIILSLILLVQGCKEKQPDPMPERKRAYLHFINLHPDYGGVDCRVQSFETNGFLFNNLGYVKTWPNGGYASLLSLQSPDSVDKAWITFELQNHQNGDSIIPKQTLTLFEEKATTMILLKDQTGNPLLVKTLDNFASDADTTTFVRFMNFDETVTSAMLISQDTSVLIDNLGFLNYTGFRAFKKGIYDISVVDKGTGTVLATFPNLNLRLRRNYSFFIVKNVLTGNSEVVLEEMNK